jgi:transcriptional regulator with XRE-family HTH domain
MESEGQRLKSLRKTLKLTQQDVADKIGVSKQYLSRVENNLTDLSKDKVILLCYNLGISVNWFLLGIGEMLLKNDTTAKNSKNNDFLNDELADIVNLYTIYFKSVFEYLNLKHPKSILGDRVEVSYILFKEDYLKADFKKVKLDDLFKQIKSQKGTEKFHNRIENSYQKIFDDKKQKLASLFKKV